MTEAYQELARKEKIRSDALAERAKAIGASAISRTLATAARLAVESVMGDSGLGQISEPAADVRAIRSDPALMMAKNNDIYAAKVTAYSEAMTALRDGYEYDAHERAKVIVAESDYLKIAVDISAQELADLQSFPVQGLTCREWSERLAFLLSSGIDEALAKPLTNAFPIKLLPMQLQSQADAHASRLASIVSEAFYAGTKASMGAIRSAMVPSAN